MTSFNQSEYITTLCSWIRVHFLYKTGDSSSILGVNYELDLDNPSCKSVLFMISW